MPVLWGKYKDNEPEKVDTCTKREADYMLREYRLAFGPGWLLWVGRKCDAPTSQDNNTIRSEAYEGRL